MPIAAIKVGDTPIEGYTLRKRIGAGGYGEVWQSDAPGGLQKALKIIYGTIDESHAMSELKSLERIRQVNHPFLLSLERIEIVENQAIIVTELAEGSLLDHFESFRRRGEPGIPRSELLEKLHDTADGLDFLAQKHMLQHLDVKPGNLLLIADRVKVADFGLVKDLHDPNQSLVSGLTPTYSAPEIFDGHPDFRSDQYSLGIVYMEMLTGQLPFAGTSTGELARQHLNQVPDLDPLPPADRPVVARALAKNPLDRYSNCRQFIEQLQKTRVAVLPSNANTNTSPTAHKTSRPFEPGTDAHASNSTLNSTCSTVSFERKFEPSFELDQFAGNWTAPRGIFIGMGGLGCQSLAQLHQRLAAHCDSRWSVDDHGWLAIDTTEETLNTITEESQPGGFPAKHVIQLPIFRPSEYRNSAPDLFEPLSRRWLYNIPKSASTEGVRPLSILAFLDHFDALKSKLKLELSRLVTTHSENPTSEGPIRVYLMASLHGGTGGGIACEMGCLVRQVLRELNCTSYRISFVATACTTLNSPTANLASAAALACLSEVSYLMSGEHETPPIHHLDRSNGSMTGRPFDWVTLVDGGLHGCQDDLESAATATAQTVFVDSQTMVSAVLAENRVASSQLHGGWLRHAGADQLNLANGLTQKSVTHWCSQHSVFSAWKYMNGTKGVSANLPEHTDGGDGQPTASGDLPLTDRASKEITKRLLTDLGVSPSANKLADLAATQQGDTMLSQWARRMSNQDEILERQLQMDIGTWKESIAKIVQMRVYNWKQIEQIQLNVVEGILDFCEHETDAMVDLLNPFSETLGPPETMTRSAHRYLKMFAEECVQVLVHFQREGKQLAGRLASWHNSLQAEQTSRGESGQIKPAELSPQLRLLVSRVNAVLESTLHREAIHILEKLPGERKPSAAAEQLQIGTRDKVNLQYVMELANELVLKFAQELQIDAADLTDDPNTSCEHEISLKNIEKHCPNAALCGGAMHRFVVSPQHQLSTVQASLRERKIADTTTLIPGPTSLGAYISCEIENLNLANTINQLWRPNAQTFQLAERLRTRVDIDWAPVMALLEFHGHQSNTPETSRNPISVVAPNTGTMQLPSHS